MIIATSRTYELNYYRGKNESHYYFKFQCKDYLLNTWEVTMREDSKIPENEELAYFIADLFENTGDYLPNESIWEITVLSVDKKKSVCIDT